MLAELNNMPVASRVWIYQASRFLRDDEVNLILQKSKEFVTGWTAHQAHLMAGATILDKLFLIFAVDESHNDASGCSIDKKVHFVREIEKQTGINFFDRMKVAYTINDKINLASVKTITELYHNGTVNENTLIFNNLVANISELNSSWKQPIKNSWVSKYLQIQSN